MWVVHCQVILLWLPIILKSLMPEDKLKTALNTSIKDSGLIQPLPGIEMPGKDSSYPPTKKRPREDYSFQGLFFASNY